jgi:transcription elongation factor GreA
MRSNSAWSSRRIAAFFVIAFTDDGETDEYEIVGSAEADPANNRLSNESPVGQAVLGHKKGEVVEVAARSGSIKLQIVSIKAA